MNATPNPQTVAAILWTLVENAVRASRKSCAGTDLRPMTASDDELTEWAEIHAASVSGHAEGEFRAALLDYRIVRDEASTNDPDIFAHRAELLAQYADAARAVDALQNETGKPADADDIAMILGASWTQLEMWCDDLADRCNVETDALREALRPVKDAAFKRDSLRAFAIVQPFARDGLVADCADPRGDTDGGAEIARVHADGDYTTAGIYRRFAQDGGGWYFADDNGARIDCTAYGESLNEDKARAALSAWIAANPARAS